MDQTAFRMALLDADKPAPHGLIDPQGRPAGKRFAVYRNNVAVGLTAALETGFPVLRKLLGDEFFAGMAGVFLRAHPPTSRMMMQYGLEMPAFLSSFPPVAHLPYLSDVARLELALRQSYHAADNNSVAASTLATMPPDRLMTARLHFGPSVSVLRSPWPIHAIWHANTATDAPAPVMRAEDVLILRPEFDPIPHLLLPGAADFITALMAGQTIGMAAEIAGENHDLSASFGLLLSGGAIIKVIEGTP